MRGALFGLALVTATAGAQGVGEAAPDGTPPSFELRIRDDAGVPARPAWLVGSLPMARGAARTSDVLLLLDEDDRPVPVQWCLLASWPDGSLRWCQAVFPAVLKKGQTRRLRVTTSRAAARPVAPAEPLRLTDAERGVMVGTGALDLAFDRRAALASRVGCGGVTVPWPATVLVLNGQEHRSDRAVPDDITVEESGPLSALVRVGGWCVGPQGEKWVRVLWRCRVFAGSAEVHLVHTVLWLEGPEVPAVAEIALEWPVPQGVEQAQIDDGNPTAPPLALRPLGVEAPAANRFAAEVYELTAGGRGREAKRPLGALAWTSAGLRTAVCTRHFWRQGPKGIRIDRDRVRLQLLAAAEQPLHVGRTRAKSHDLRLVFEAAASAGPLADLAASWQTPPLPTVDPSYACATEALTVLSPVDPTFWPEFETAAAAALQAFLDEAGNDPQYWGLMNFGDTPMAQGGYGHKGVAYVDQEYDLAHTLYQLYLRSGDRRCFDWGLVAARHFMDVDVDQAKGHNRFHGYSDRCESHQAVTAGLEWGHIMCDGLVDTYYLTGDRRALEKARGIGDVAARLGQTADFGDKRAVFQVAERNLGWPLLTLMRVYEATLDPRYRQAADRIVAYANHYAIDPLAELKHGTWWRSWMIDGSKVFMIGLLHEGLDKHHQLTGAADTKRSILTSLDWMIEHMWRQDLETFMYEFNAYNPGHRDVWPTDLNLMVVHAFGYGYRISGDPRYLDVGLRALRSAVARMPAAAKHGKEFAMQFRTNLEMVGQLYRARGNFTWPPPTTSGEAPAPPQPVQVVPAGLFPEGAAPGKPVLLPGAQPSAQSGDLDIRSRAGTLAGHVLTSWEEDGSWAEWETSLDTAGHYALLVRYAAKEDALRALALDGQAAGEIALAATGGWGEAPGGFRYALAAAGPQARLLHLAAGTHRVRLTHTKGGLALDFAALVPVAAGVAIPAGTTAPRSRPPAVPIASYPFDDDDPRIVWQTLAGKVTPPATVWVEGSRGKGIHPGTVAWATVTVPPDTLARAGALTLAFRLDHKLSRESVGQRALLHVMGDEPFCNALTICTIYHEIRVRLYDEKGHLCGTLEADASAWEPGQWHRLALTWDEGAMRLDLDGKPAATTSRVRLPQRPVATCHLGWRPGNWHLDAALDELTISHGWKTE